MDRFSIYEAKAQLSAILRRVKQQRRVCITERGRDIAWIVPAPNPVEGDLPARIAALEAAGAVEGPAGGTPKDIAPATKRKGALARFLAERD